MATPDVDLRYPIGCHATLTVASAAVRAEALDAIAGLPARLRAVVDGLTGTQWDTPYRPGGWTVRQVVHHVADSHMNAYVRCRLALTEDGPLIKTYEEGRWAELDDARTAPPALSLSLLDALHERWVLLLRALPEAAFRRTLQHPELGMLTLDGVVGLYAWHGRHHVAHLEGLRRREGW